MPEVIDVWYDSGAMPFAQFGAPHRNQAEFERAYPAQYICEAIDQTRGWFYTLMAIGTLVFGRSSYQKVLCLGLAGRRARAQDEQAPGQRARPDRADRRHGADAVRWFIAAGGSPWATRRIGHGTLEEIVRKILLTYWNTASFLLLYAKRRRPRASWRRPAGGRAAGRGAAGADRWLLSELQALVRRGHARWRTSTPRRRARIAGFIDDLSNWYVRRSRRRFWGGPGTPDGAAAFATLHECLDTLTQLMAPITPFLTDYLWGGCAAGTRPTRCTWPVAGRGRRPHRRRARRRRWRWPGGWSSSAGRRGPARRCGSASRWPAP